MATSLQINSGSVLIGNPIGISVRAESVSGNIAFHKVKLVVKASLSSDGIQEEFVMSATAGNEDTVEFDISDALRTVAGRFSFSPVESDHTYPYLSYTLSAYDEYMADGILHEKVGEQIYPGTLYALMGAFTDAERMAAGDTKVLKAYSRKPNEGEVCHPEEGLVYPVESGFSLGMKDKITAGPTVKCMDLTGKSGIQKVGDRTIYVDQNAENRIQFQFVNGLGIVESISAETLSGMETKGEIEMNTVSASTSFGNINRMYGKKSGRRPVLSCSTGLINYDWACWWHDEFFGSDKFRNTISTGCWVKIGGRWYPCVAYLEDDAPLYNQAEQKGIQLNFTVEIGIDGLPHPYL